MTPYIVGIEDLHTNEQARDFYIDARWPDGFECPRCSSKKGYFIESRKLFECATCRKQTSATANTVYHGTRTLLLDLKLLDLMAKGTNESARALSRTFKICYTTMWHHAHVARLILESLGESQKAMIDCARLKRALFKQSKEEKTPPPVLASAMFRQEAPQEIVSDAITFLLVVFTGVSRKFAQSYITQFSLFSNKIPERPLATLLRGAFSAKSHTRRDLCKYRSPPAVLISSPSIQAVSL